MRRRFDIFLSQASSFDSISLANDQGTIILSTGNPQEGSSKPSFAITDKQGEAPYIYIQTDNPISVFVIQPVYGPDNEIVGALIGQVNITNLYSILLNSSGLGRTGQSYLVNEQNILLTPSLNTNVGDSIHSKSIDSAKTTRTGGSYTGLDYRGKQVIGIYKWLPALNTALIVEQEVTETSQSTYAVLAVNLGVAVAAIIVAAIASLNVTHSIATPLKNLKDIAGKIAAGNLGLSADIEHNDEIGELAQSFNNMTTQLRRSLGELEARVQERTADLQRRTEELSRQTLEMERVNKITQKRANQLQAISEVSKAIANIQKMNVLLPKISQLVSDKFDFYHVGIFLLDESEKYAVLVASNSEGGKRMLARGHRLEVGKVGIVGYVTSTGNSRIALDTGSDATYFNNPDLPETHSEIAVPLIAGKRIIGALDVQSTGTNAFGQDDIDVINTLADQLTIAIENVRLYEEAQRSLAEVETIYRQYLRREWEQMTKIEDILGYRYTITGIAPLEKPLQIPAAKQAIASGAIKIDFDEQTQEAVLAVPIKLREETIGILNVRTPGKKTWRDDEISVVQAIAERVATSAENARLFEETTKRAERERKVAEITSKIRSTNDPNEMMQIALTEIKQSLKVKEVRLAANDTRHDPK
jgi:GAF domain-containing protein/HAMP domain-containing protein